MTQQTFGIVLAGVSLGLMLTTWALVIFALWREARRTPEAFSEDGRHAACGQGCKRRSGDGPRLRLHDNVDAFVRGDMTLREIRDHLEDK